MSADSPSIDEVYRRYVDLLLRHDRLLSEGKDEDAETEHVEEEMTRLWEELDDRQRPSLSGLSSDLNWVRRRGEPAPRARPAGDVTPQDFQALAQAKQAGDWHGVLHYLRVCAPRTPPFQLAHLRAAAWAALGLPQLAGVFSGLAAGLEPGERLDHCSGF